MEWTLLLTIYAREALRFSTVPTIVSTASASWSCGTATGSSWRSARILGGAPPDLRMKLPLARRPLDREGVCLDGGRTTQLRRDSLAGTRMLDLAPGQGLGPIRFGMTPATCRKSLVLFVTAPAPSSCAIR